MIGSAGTVCIRLYDLPVGTDSEDALVHLPPSKISRIPYRPEARV